MKTLEGIFTVEKLIKLGIIERPIDGNHGSYHPTSEEYVKEGIPFVMASDLIDGVIDYKGCKKISKERAERLQKGFSIDGDVLLTHKATIGRTAIVSGNGNNNYIMLTPQVTYYRIKNPNILDNRYLKYYFDSLEFQNIFLQWAGGGSTRAYLGITAQEQLPIKFPDIKTQRKIISIIDPINLKIHINNQINQTLESMAKAIFKEWFIDFGPVKAKAEGKKPYSMDDETAALFPDSFEESELGLIPKGWRVSCIKKQVDISRGSSPRPIQEFMGNDLPWFKIADATASNSPYIFKTKEMIKKEGEKFSVLVEPGDFIVSNSATCGVPKFVQLRGCVHDGWLVFKNFKIEQIFLYHAFVFIAPHLIQIADGSVQKNLNTTLVGEQKIIIPPQPLIKRFSQTAEKFFDQILNLEKETNSLTQTRDLLLPKLISGEIQLKKVDFD